MGSSGCSTKNGKASKYNQSAQAEDTIFKYLVGACALSALGIGALWYMSKKQ